MSEKVDTESFKEFARLRELRVSHRDLDYLIDSLSHDPMVDQLRIRRLKKRRLVLKDMIVRLESDTNAWRSDGVNWSADGNVVRADRGPAKGRIDEKASAV